MRKKPSASRRSRARAQPVGLLPPPRHAPAVLRTRRDLQAWQRFILHGLVQPLTARGDIDPRWRDGRSAATVVAEVIKPSAQLASLERLQIYARCYWYRITESATEDCPGLRALLGERKFAALIRAFLIKYPSRSWTLRHLCERLPRFIAEEPRWTAPRTDLAQTIARFEWAQTQAFDAGERPPLTREEIASASPTRLRLGLQPHLTLLAADWPVHEFVVAVKQREAERAIASNAATSASGTHRRLARVRPPRRVRTFVVVHRYRHRLYYKPVSAAAFSVLTALAAGRTLSQAVKAAGLRVTPGEVQEWFTTWMELGWFCCRASHEKE